jgi:pentatricopeptide repeat protein
MQGFTRITTDCKSSFPSYISKYKPNECSLNYIFEQCIFEFSLPLPKTTKWTMHMNVTFVGVLNTCANTVALQEGRCVHEWIESRWDSDVFVGNKLVDMYAKCGNMEDVWRVFNKISSPNVMRWTTMILGHLKIGQAQKALEQF